MTTAFCVCFISNVDLSACLGPVCEGYILVNCMEIKLKTYLLILRCFFFLQFTYLSCRLIPDINAECWDSGGTSPARLEGDDPQQLSADITRSIFRSKVFQDMLTHCQVWKFRSYVPVPVVICCFCVYTVFYILKRKISLTNVMVGIILMGKSLIIVRLLKTLAWCSPRMLTCWGRSTTEAPDSYRSGGSGGFGVVWILLFQTGLN